MITDINRQLEMARIAYPEQNFTVEDIKNEKVEVLLDSGLRDEDEAVKIFKLCRDMFGNETKVCPVSVFVGEDGYYITDDENEAIDISENKTNGLEWLNDYNYFVVELEGCYYSEYFKGDEEYEYLVEFTQI